MKRLLLLAGAGEARAVAQGLAEMGAEAVASLEGSARFLRGLALPTRHGGFGGAAGFERYLDEQEIAAVLDVTHPFAEEISARTAARCAARGLPYALLWRPAWQPEAGDDWVALENEAEAAAHIPAGSTVFVATGRRGLAGFANLCNCEVIARRIAEVAPEPFPFAGGRYLASVAPFSVAEEEALFRQLEVDWLVVKNAGGEGARPKLHAARNLGLKVGMIARPAPPEGVTLLATVEEALDWARAHG